MPLFNKKSSISCAFFLFEKDVKSKVKKQYPNKKEYEINNIIAKMWIEGEPSKRLKYYDLEKSKQRKVVKNPLYGK